VCVLTGRPVRHAYGEKRVVAVGLEDTQPLSCDLLLLCADRRPNVELAQAAGLPVRRGIVVDDTMRTSHPHVFAVGMAAECLGRVATAWPACVEQARIAAEHAVTRKPPRTRHYRAGSALTELELPGVHVAAVGRTRPGAGDHVLVVEQPHRRLYRKIVLTGSGTVAGGISVNEPGAAAALLESAVTDRSNVRRHLAELRSGDLATLRAATESSRRARRRTRGGTRGKGPVGHQETERFMVDVERIWRIKTSSNGDLEVRLAPTHSGDRQVRLEQVGADESGLQALDLVAARALAETLLEACEVASALRPSGGGASL
jgi:hypothetical protein